MNDKFCRACGTKMRRDRNEWYCPGCGYREKRKKKINYRTKRDIQENLKNE